MLYTVAMNLSRVMIFVLLGLILGVPFVLKPAAVADTRAKVEKLIIITPHVQQISAEYGPAFERWMKRAHNRDVKIDWRGPLGTSEILKLLQSQYNAAVSRGELKPEGSSFSCPPGTVSYDLMFGGGSYDHGRLKKGDGVFFTVTDPEGKPKRVNVPMSIPAGFSQEQLLAWYGPTNLVGTQPLYDKDQFWLGNCLSAFGIVYNKPLCEKLGVKPPTHFSDLADPKLAGWVALADPRQSGSLTTALDSILSAYGWEKGWRVLREMCANSRSYTNSSTKPPIDVSQGEAAMALAIDFYGRGQAQAILAPGETAADSRVGYVDPPGEVAVDADPVSILRGGPNFELAQRFVEFLLTDEGQLLWQLPSQRDPRGKENPKGDDAQPLGPRLYELRRMPIRPETYTKYRSHFVDDIDPFAIASKATPGKWRAAIGPMLGAFAIDNAHEQREAWNTVNAARAKLGSEDPLTKELEGLFYAWPATTLPDGRVLEFTEANFKEIKAAWDKNGFGAVAAVEYTKHYRATYNTIIEKGRTLR